jgi:hypothetical protein
MIYFVTTHNHRYTTARVERKLGRSAVRRTTYDRLFGQRSFAPGTYVFTDMERMEDWELGLAAELYRQLATAGPGFRVVNDPARVKCRYALLRTLREAGINDFDAYRADEARKPGRFPVFLREHAHHAMPLTDLIDSQEMLDATLEDVTRLGIPLGSVLIIEYAAEPVRENWFRKYAAIRAGRAIVALHVIHDSTWLVKYGHKGAMEQEDRLLEAAYIYDNPHASEIRRIFELANIEYGRIDYGLVGGRIQVYEVNTNPLIGFEVNFITDIKRQAYAHAEAGVLEAISALDPGNRKVARARPTSPGLAAARRSWRFLYSRRPRA